MTNMRYGLGLPYLGLSGTLVLSNYPFHDNIGLDHFNALEKNYCNVGWFLIHCPNVM